MTELPALVPFVPVGWSRRLQRIDGKSLILVFVVSIPTAPTKSPVQSDVLATRNPRFAAYKALVLAPSWPQILG